MNWNRPLPRACAASLLSLVAMPVFAQQLEAHEHGQATGQLAVDIGEVSLRLRMPGFNLVGFEHPPRNEGQQLRFDRALKRLEEGAWLRSPATAQCVTTRLEIHTPGFGVASPDQHDHDHEHDHDHNQEHEHDHEHQHDQENEHHNQDRHNDYHDDGHEHEHNHHDDGRHAEFEIEVELECAQPARLAWIELDLFEGWYDNSRLRLDVLTATMVRQFDLRAGTGRVDLQ